MEGITPEELENRKKEALDIAEKVKHGDAQLFDVREKVEWEEGHLTIADLIPLSDLQAGEEPPDKYDREALTFLHCRSGGRVMVAAPILQSMGFENVVALPMGFDELSSYGLEAK